MVRYSIQDRDFQWHRERSTAVHFSGQSGLSLILSAISFLERDVLVKREKLKQTEFKMCCSMLQVDEVLQVNVLLRNAVDTDFNLESFRVSFYGFDKSSEVS